MSEVMFAESCSNTKFRRLQACAAAVINIKSLQHQLLTDPLTNVEKSKTGDIIKFRK